MSMFSYRQRNNIILVIIVGVAGIILYSLLGIFSALLSTLVLYTLLRPGYIYLTEERRWNHSISAIVLLTLSILVLVLPFYGLSNMVIAKITEVKNDPIYLKNILYRIKHLLPLEDSSQSYLEDVLKKAGSWLTALFPTLISGVFNTVFGLLLMYFLLYFMLKERKTFEATLLKYAPFRQQNALRFAEEMRTTTYANVLGQGLIAVVQGSLVSLAFYVLNYNDPLFWGVITTFISFMPVLGAPVVFVPAAILQIADGNNYAGWAMLIFGFVVIINIDNVLRFIIAKRVGDIHPVVTVLGVVVGLPLFGILGLVFGPLLLSYLVLLVKIYETSSLASERLERIKTNQQQEEL